MRLEQFLSQVYSRVESLVTDGRLHPAQRDILSRFFARYRYKTAPNPASDPVAIFHYVHSARGAVPGERSFDAAAFCVLFLLSADLLDDIQDGELDGALHGAGGAPIAINNAVLLLVLALESLTRAMRDAGGGDGALAHMSLFVRVAVQALRGQHMDLERDAGRRSVDQVLEINRSKTASLALIAESAALCAGCDEEAVALYRGAGERMSGLVQLVDDVRDIYGKPASPDLESGKTTYPIAVFLERASREERDRFERLRAALPESLPDIRRLLYDRSVVKECAEAIEGERSALHELLASTGIPGPGHRMWLHIADTLAGAVYELPHLECSAFILEPAGGWHDRVRAEVRRIAQRLGPLGLPPPPRFIPWHRREWVYVPEQDRIFYSDLQDQAEEIVPLQAAMLGASEEETVALLEETVAGVVAHELFHFWRKAAGVITGDLWLEEWAANRLAAAYLKRHEPALAKTSVGLAARIKRASGERLCAEAAKILEELSAPGTVPAPVARPYGMDPGQMVLMQAEMIGRIYAEDLDLSAEVARWLTPK